MQIFFLSLLYFSYSECPKLKLGLLFFLLSSLRYCNRRYFSLYCLKFDKWTKRFGWFNTNKHVVIWNNNYIAFLYWLPSHTQQKETVVIQPTADKRHLCRCDWELVLVTSVCRNTENSLSLCMNRGQIVVQSKQGSSSLPRKETN